MRFFSTIVAALAVAQGALAVDVQKSIIVTFPEGTPEDVVTRAKDEIRQAGGVVTHDYKLFKCVSAWPALDFSLSLSRLRLCLSPRASLPC